MRRRTTSAMLMATIAAIVAIVVFDLVTGNPRYFGFPDFVWWAALLMANLAVTRAFPRFKRAVVVAVQRRLINPPVRWLLTRGLAPPGYALLETRGRRTGRRRVVPVGDGLLDGTFWIVAEHGTGASYVANLGADPRVRISRRSGWRQQWIGGTARVRADLDPWAVQRSFCGWRPMRWFNAWQLRLLASDPVVIEIELDARAIPTDENPHLDPY